MKHSLAGVLTLLVLVTFSLVGSPKLGPGSVVNGASFAVNGSPNGAVAQGSLFSVFGEAIGPATPVQAREFPLPTRLGGVSVRVLASNGQQYECILIYASSTQVSGILPSAVPVGPATLTLAFNAGSSTGVEFLVAARSFGIFSQNATGTGLGVIQNYLTPDIQPANGLGASAVPGQIAVLWGTGLGASLNADDRNPPAPGNQVDLAEIQVYVGSKQAEVLYAGRSGCCAGVDQVNFVVPEDVEGCFVPVTVSVQGIPSNFATMAIASTPGVCEGAFGLSKSELEPLLGMETVRLGQVTLQRTRIDNPFLSFSSDTGLVTFAEYTGQGFRTAGEAFAGTTLVPGTCMVSSFRHDAFVQDGDPVPPDIPNLFRVRGINAGAVIMVRGALGFRLLGLAPNSGGTYRGTLGDASDPLRGFLTAGQYTISNGAGGNDVGPFTFAKIVPPFDPWTNREAINTITRSEGLTITWEPGLNPTGVITISALSLSVPKKVASLLRCQAASAGGQFTVPPHVLSAMVESDAGLLPLLSTGTLTVGGISRPSPFSAPGIDVGLFSSTFTQSKQVKFE